FVGAAGMVDMAMGEPDLLDPEAIAFDRVEDGLHIAAGIDHHTDLAVGIEQQRAILLEWRHRNDTGLQSTHRELPNGKTEAIAHLRTKAKTGTWRITVESGFVMAG